MAKHLVIAVEWFGPFRGLDAAKKALANDGWGSGLYMAIGRPEEGGPICPQYVGISSSLKSRVGERHPTLSKIEDLQLWLGEVSTAEPSGRQVAKTARTLNYAEWLSAYFMSLPRNTKKRVSIPDYPVTLLNRWWKTDYETLFVKRPHPDWPDLIDHLGHEYDAKIVWFGRKMKREKALSQSK